MSARALVAVVLCSTLVTLDGTAVTVALPDARSDLRAPFSALQWITNASLLMLAALLIPAGALGDRFGRRRVMAAGLLLFASASAACAAAPSAGWLIALRFVQGAGAALMIPGAVAILRTGYRDEVARTRAFGVAAGASGVASALGPVLGGALVDLWSWRGVFVASAALSVPALLLLRGAPDSRSESREPVSLGGTTLVVALLASVSYALIEGGGGRWTSPAVLAAIAVAAGSVVALLRHGRLHTVVPPEIATSRNCVAANLVTAALYFGLFGISFLLAIYTQAVLGYSGTWAGLSVLPIAFMMLLSERFGGAAAAFGSRVLITVGALTSGAGVLWLAFGPDPLPFWTRIIPATALFGLGLAMASGPLTHAAVSSVSARDAGAASGVHHGIVRAAGLVAIAALGTIAADGNGADGLTPEGFRAALIVCAGVVLLPGVIFARSIADHEAGGLEKAA